MKNPRTTRNPSTIVNRTVTPRRPRNADLREREYLTPKEVDRLQDAARKHSRYGAEWFCPQHSAPIIGPHAMGMECNIPGKVLRTVGSMSACEGEV